MKYFVKNIKFYGFHGNTEHEKNNPQLYNISLSYAIENMKKSDNINDFIDYSLVYNRVKNLFYKKRYNLIETLAYDIHADLLSRFNINNLEILVTKNNPLKNNTIESISFEYK